MDQVNRLALLLSIFMKNITLILLLLANGTNLYCQDPEVENYQDKIANQMQLFYTYCPVSEDKIEEVWKDLQEIKGEIEVYIKKGGHAKSDYEAFVSLVNICETLDDYMICVGDWNRFPIQRSTFDKGAELMQASSTYLFSGKYCVNLIELTMGNYKCLLAENRGSSTVKVKYNFSTPTGKQTGEMGLSSGSVRVMINNRDCSEYEKIVVNSIECSTF